MRALTRKMTRDAWRLRGQLAAIALVIACGVAVLVMSLSATAALSRSLDGYYDRARFPDVFLSLKRAPLALLDRVRELPGVAEAEARVSIGAALDLPGVLEPALGRLVSIPDRGEPALSRLHLRAGRLPDPGRHDEAVVSEAFSEALGLRPGDSVEAVIRGGLETVRIVGVGLSPEHVYSIPPGTFFPDDRRYGVFWMMRRGLAEAADLDGAFNDLVVRLEPGANERAVIEAIDRLAAPYGGAGAFSRDDQTSHRYVADELEQLRAMASVTPTVFLAVSALLLNVVLSRLVRTQREQIGVLKAFGYRRRDIAMHYLSLASAVVLVGAGLGVVGGAALADFMLTLYARFFRFPVVDAGVSASACFTAVGASLAAACFGAIGAVRRAAALPPAVAMRPEAPADYRASVLDAVRLAPRMSPATRMIVRHVERQPGRAAASVLGVAMAIAVLTLGTYVEDAIEFLIDFQFSASQRYDIAVTFIEPRNQRAVRELAALPGVLLAEPVRTVPVRLRHGPVVSLQSVTGVADSPTLSRTLDESGRAIPIPPEGLVLTENLAAELGAPPGSTIVVEVLDGQRPVIEARVEAVAASYIGSAAYMDLDALRRVLREGDDANGAFLSVDSGEAPALYRALKETPGVLGVSVKRAALDSFEKTLAESLLLMRLFNLAFASVIAVGVVYNGARISLAERSQEFATLRVLGFSRAEVGSIFFGELALLTLLAVPLGLALGYWLSALATAALQTESHRIPFVVTPGTLAHAAAFVLTAAVATAWSVRRQIDRLDLLAAMKAAG